MTKKKKKKKMPRKYAKQKDMVHFGRFTRRQKLPRRIRDMTAVWAAKKKKKDPNKLTGALREYIGLMGWKRAYVLRKWRELYGNVLSDQIWHGIVGGRLKCTARNAVRFSEVFNAIRGDMLTARETEPEDFFAHKINLDKIAKEIRLRYPEPEPEPEDGMEQLLKEMKDDVIF